MVPPLWLCNDCCRIWKFYTSFIFFYHAPIISGVPTVILLSDSAA